MTHGLRNVAGFESIVKFVDHLDDARHLDEDLGPVEKAQMAARVAHVERELGDLVVSKPPSCPPAQLIALPSRHMCSMHSAAIGLHAANVYGCTT